MKILLGMSGGLDSTYAACLLKEQGHEVVGCALRMHGYTPTADAEIAARQAGIPLVILSCEAEFEEKVIAPFLTMYAVGRTPNPCVLCNPGVKFEALCRYAAENGFDAVATGHYSSVLRDEESGRYYVRMADDPSKDQSYALWGLRQDQLAVLYLPLAGERKEEIRARAAKLGLVAASAKESMENCFIPDNDYAAYLASRGIPSPKGDFVTTDGQIVGTHSGIIHYTVGQRKGLGLAMGRPVFVTAIDPDLNRVVIGDSADLMSDRATIRGLNFQKQPPIAATLRARVKIRYAAPPVPATVTIAPDLQSAEITFNQPVRAITPGQSAVAYGEDGEVLMGGVF